MEPEKRAFPLAISVDVEQGNYVVSYAMADLPLMTGQGKDQGEAGETQNTGTSFTGQNFREIREQYDSSQEYMLDLGHVQALILGEALLADPEKRQELFEEIGNSPVIGRNLYLFQTQDPDLVMEQNGKEKDSVGGISGGILRKSAREKAAKAGDPGRFFLRVEQPRHSAGASGAGVPPGADFSERNCIKRAGSVHPLKNST